MPGKPKGDATVRAFFVMAMLTTPAPLSSTSLTKSGSCERTAAVSAAGAESAAWAIGAASSAAQIEATSAVWVKVFFIFVDSCWPAPDAAGRRFPLFLRWERLYPTGMAAAETRP